MTPPLTKQSGFSKKYAFLTLWFTFLTVIAGIAAYYKMFIGFSVWDDEGTFMVSVKQYLSRMKLYDQIFVNYGPVYYFYNWAIRTFSKTPVTHDVVRMSSLIPLLLTALVSAWIIYRLTGSLVLASATHLLTFVILSFFFHNEPGHPQELSILLLVCVVACGVLTLIPDWRLLGMISLGALTAALLLIKVNIGTYVFLGTSLALLSHSPKTKLSRLAFNVVGAACIILPAVLMKAHMDDAPTRRYAILATISMMAVLLVLLKVPRSCSLSFRDSWIAITSFASTIVAAILVLQYQGVFLYSMLRALVLDSFRIYVSQGRWYVPLPREPRWSLWIVGGLVAAVFFSRNTAGIDRAKYKLLYLKLALGGFVLTAVYLGISILWFVAPFCWLVLFGRPEDDGESHSFPRTLLCTVSVLQTLYAYPIAGSQNSFIQVLLIIAIMVCLGDFLLWHRKRGPIIRPFLVRAATPMLLVCIATPYFIIARSERDTYKVLPSLNLHGATRIHLDDGQAQDYRWLVQNIDDHCDVFVSLPEVPSLHIWTDKDTLDGLDMDDWIFYASNEQQIAVSKALSAHPNACEVYNPALVAFWNHTHQDLDLLPLVRYLHGNFKVVGRTGQFSLLVRNDRNLSLVSGP